MNRSGDDDPLENLPVTGENHDLDTHQKRNTRDRRGLSILDRIRSVHTLGSSGYVRFAQEL